MAETAMADGFMPQHPIPLREHIKTLPLLRRVTGIEVYGAYVAHYGVPPERHQDGRCVYLIEELAFLLNEQRDPGAKRLGHWRKLLPIPSNWTKEKAWEALAGNGLPGWFARCCIAGRALWLPENDAEHLCFVSAQRRQAYGQAPAPARWSLPLAH